MVVPPAKQSLEDSRLLACGSCCSRVNVASTRDCSLWAMGTLRRCATPKGRSRVKKVGRAPRERMCLLRLIEVGIVLVAACDGMA